MKSLPYIAIFILICIILLQNFGKKVDIPAPKIDTVIVEKIVRDTIPGKPIYIKSKIDTSIWIKKSENVPDTTYKGLLSQYKSIGNKYFSTNLFKTDFSIGEYGSVSVTDTISENGLIGSSLVTNLKIPTTTITIEKEIPKKNQFYIGIELSGTVKTPLSDIYGGLLLKTKREYIYGAAVGFNESIKYKGSLYFPIKIK